MACEDWTFVTVIAGRGTHQEYRFDAFACEGQYAAACGGGSGTSIEFLGETLADVVEQVHRFVDGGGQTASRGGGCYAGGGMFRGPFHHDPVRPPAPTEFYRAWPPILRPSQREGFVAAWVGVGGATIDAAGGGGMAAARPDLKPVLGAV